MNKIWDVSIKGKTKGYKFKSKRRAQEFQRRAKKKGVSASILWQGGAIESYFLSNGIIRGFKKGFFK
jgi:hypothetical protein